MVSILSSGMSPENGYQMALIRFSLRVSDDDAFV